MLLSYKQEWTEFDTRKSTPKGNTKWYSSGRRKTIPCGKTWKDVEKATKMVNMWINLNNDWL